MKKRILISALALGLGVTTAWAVPRTVTIGLSADAYSMDPYSLNETINNAIVMHMFDPLVDSDPDLQSEAALAESWEPSEDARVWTFHLRKGVTFSNGSTFDADDVLFSCERARRAGKSAFEYTLAGVEKIEKVDDHTVRFVCKEPVVLLVAQLKDLVIMDKETCEGHDDDWIALHPVGTGRYKLDEFVRGDRIVFVRNDGYWGEKPQVERVVFKPITNDGTRTANAMSGAVDMIVNVPVRDVKMLERNKKLRLIVEPSLRVMYLNLAQVEHPSRDAKMPMQSPDHSNPFMKLKVRQALYRAINEDEIVAKVMNGFATPTATLSPAGFNGYAQDVKRLSYDPKLAERLLDGAGYPRKKDGYRFEVTLDASNDRYANDGDIAAAVAGYFEKVGVKVNLNLMSRTVFFSFISTSNRMGDNTHLCQTGWADSGGEGAFLVRDLFYSFNQSGKAVKEGYGAVNRGYYHNATVDELIDKALSTVDPAARGELVKKVWELAAADVALIPLHFQDALYAVSGKLDYHPRKNQYVFAWDVTFKD